MKILIVDDEKNVIEGLEELLKIYCPYIEVVGSTGSVRSTIDFLDLQSVDLIFLDIELSDGTGLELLEKINHQNFQVIFITAYDKYAIEAFKYSSVDYLLKPIDPDDLTKAVDRAKDILEKEQVKMRIETLISNLSDISLQDRKLIVSDKEHIHALKVNEILYLQADGAYTRFYLSGYEVLSSRNLKIYEDLLKDAGFFRTHHSYLVNLAHMKRFDRHDNVLCLVNNMNIPVSTRKKELLLDKVKDFSFL